MTRGWILDTGAVFRAADRETVVALLPAAHQQGHRIVVPQHVLLELARQLMVKLAKDQRRAGVARDVDPAQVFQDVREQLEGVEVLPFEQEDAVALLGWLESEAFRVAEHGQPPRPGLVWEHIKLAKAARDGGPPIRKAVRDLPCPSLWQSHSELRVRDRNLEARIRMERGVGQRCAPRRKLRR